jgi:hypothetical protein
MLLIKLLLLLLSHVALVLGIVATIIVTIIVTVDYRRRCGCSSTSSLLISPTNDVIGLTSSNRYRFRQMTEQHSLLLRLLALLVLLSSSSSLS